jgi:hypothetical protein
VEGGKELWYGRWKVKGAKVWKVEGRKELRYGRWKVERSCGMEGGRRKGAVEWKVVERSCGMEGVRWKGAWGIEGGRWKVFDGMDKADKS